MTIGIDVVDDRFTDLLRIAGLVALIIVDARTTAHMGRIILIPATTPRLERLARPGVLRQHVRFEESQNELHQTLDELKAAPPIDGACLLHPSTPEPAAPVEVDDTMPENVPEAVS